MQVESGHAQVNHSAPSGDAAAAREALIDGAGAARGEGVTAADCCTEFKLFPEADWTKSFNRAEVVLELTAFIRELFGRAAGEVVLSQRPVETCGGTWPNARLGSPSCSELGVNEDALPTAFAFVVMVQLEDELRTAAGGMRAAESVWSVFSRSLSPSGLVISSADRALVEPEEAVVKETAVGEETSGSDTTRVEIEMKLSRSGSRSSVGSSQCIGDDTGADAGVELLEARLSQRSDCTTAGVGMGVERGRSGGGGGTDGGKID